MKKLLKQALSFFLISGIGWLMDVLIYTILTNIGFPVIFANIISSTVAVTYVYITSTKKLFVNDSNINLKVKYIFYIVYQVCMILLSSFIIYLITKWFNNIFDETSNSLFKFILQHDKLSAKILVTPFTMTINFIFMKFLIEKVGKKK